MKKENKITFTEYFEEIEAIENYENYEGYFCRLTDALTIVILGTLCGLRNMKQIQQWASNERVETFLKTYFDIQHVPCYYWLICLMKRIETQSLQRCFTQWVASMLPEDKSQLTLSFDGKTICFTHQMTSYQKPLHIVSAHAAQLGLTFGSLATTGKNHEIPTVRDLIGLLDLEGCLIVADALNCQKKTAKAVVEAKADYLLSVKNNHPTLKQDLQDYVQDPALRQEMKKETTKEKNRGRMEERTAYVSSDIHWLEGKEEWENLTCMGAIQTKITTSKEVTETWQYYLSSRELTAHELHQHARLEWSVESMHWLLDVHYQEDGCRVEDEGVQIKLNVVRKIALNTLKRYKTQMQSKRALSHLMLDGLLDPHHLLTILSALASE